MYRGSGKGPDAVSCAATHSFQWNTLYRDRNYITKAYIHAATHHFARNNMCRGSEKGPDAVSHAATHLFRAENLCREKRKESMQQVRERVQVQELERVQETRNRNWNEKK